MIAEMLASGWGRNSSIGCDRCGAVWEEHECCIACGLCVCVCGQYVVGDEDLLTSELAGDD